MVEYKVRLKDHEGEVVAEFDQDAIKALKYTHMVNSHGSCRVEISGRDERRELFITDYQIEIWRRDLAVRLDWYLEWEGFMRTENDFTLSIDVERFVAWGFGYSHLLARAFVMYPSLSAGASKSGVGETVLKEYVFQNIGAAALVANGRLGDNVKAGLSIQADAGSGLTWEGSRAYKNLLLTLQEIATLTDVDYDVVSVGKALWEFRVYDSQRGEDRTIVGLDPATGRNAVGNVPIVFSLRRGNMAVPALSHNRSEELNAIYTLGQGVEDERIFTLSEDAAAQAISPWNRIEHVRNATQETEEGALEDVGEALLDQRSGVRNTLDFSVLQIPSVYYGKDYTWGDRVTAEYRTEIFNKKITQVVVVVNLEEGEQITIEYGDEPFIG
jgi:hypothetical protein